MPSPLLGSSSSSSDGLLDELRAGSVVRFHIDFIAVVISITTITITITTTTTTITITITS